MLPQQTTVLIVGAGPAGLAVAVSLLAQGFNDFVIVDAVEANARPVSSRAIIVYSATLEVLDRLGVAEKLTALGLKIRHLDIYTPAGHLTREDFHSLSKRTRFPYMLVVSQYTTERVLEKTIEDQGVKVQRPHRLVSLSSDEDGMNIVTFDGGEQIKAKYVIGADGARSSVRQLVNLGFTDPDSTNADKYGLQLVFADVTFASPPSQAVNGIICRYISDSGFFLTIPVPRSPFPESHESSADGIYRLGITIPKEDGAPPSSPGVDYVQKYLDKYRPEFIYPGRKGASGLKVENVLWSTRLLVRAAIADRFYVKLPAQNPAQNANPRTVFLVGDAAHIHSPVGGQGMNLGLRDAIGLGPALIKHMKLFPQYPSAADKVLEDYADKRRASAMSTIQYTKKTTSFIRSLGVMTASWTTHFMWAAKLFFMLPSVSKSSVWGASGLSRA